MTRAASFFVALAIAACSPLEVSTEDRRAALDADEARLADEVLGRPLTLSLGLEAAPVVFGDDGVARVDAQALDWALQGIRRVPQAVEQALVFDSAEAHDGRRSFGLNDTAELDDATAMLTLAHDALGGADALPVVLVADQQGIRWTTTFALDAPTTAALSIAVETIEGAVVEFVLDGERVGPLRDLWRPSRRELTVELGVHALSAGEHVLDVVFLEGGASQLGIEELVLTRR